MKTQLLLVMTAALALGACTPTEEEKQVMDKATEVLTAGAETMEKTGEMMEETGDKMMEVKDQAEEVMMAKSATYTDYEASAGEGKKHILFFHAPWCGTCVAWEKMINEKMDTLAENVLILKASYDDDAELKKMYEINKQSTAVFINADGSVAKTEMDPSLESVQAFFAE